MERKSGGVETRRVFSPTTGYQKMRVKTSSPFSGCLGGLRRGRDEKIGRGLNVEQWASMRDDERALKMRKCPLKPATLVVSVAHHGLFLALVSSTLATCFPDFDRSGLSVFHYRHLRVFFIDILCISFPTLGGDSPMLKAHLLQVCAFCFSPSLDPGTSLVGIGQLFKQETRMPCG